jgi:hypothetical protein
MTQTQRRGLALAPALLLVVVLAGIARPTAPGRDRRGGDGSGGNICLIAGDVVACVPPGDSPS